MAAVVRRLAALLALWAACAALAAGDEAARREVEARLAQLADASGGTLGVSALNVKSGERVQFNADQPFPMASTFKLPLALAVLDQVDRGAMRLDEMVAIDPRNLSPGSGELKATQPGAEKSAPVGELLELMMRNSDNTATDYLMASVGGSKAVNAHLRAMGVTGLEIHRPAAQLVADAWGFRLPPRGQRTAQNLQRAVRAVPQEKRAVAARIFLEDRRDTTTPDAMVAVLERLHAGKALGPRSTELLLAHMENCRTGPRRLKGELPRGISVAHKTGTLTRVATNDVGIVPLGWNNGPMVIALYLKGSDEPIAAQERTVAQAALAVYRYFTR